MAPGEVVDISVIFLVLSVLLWTIASLVLLVVLALAALLFLPVTFRFHGSPDFCTDEEKGTEFGGRLPWQADLAWGWGLFRVWLKGIGRDVGTAEASICGFRLRHRRETTRPRPPRPRRQRKPLDRSALREYFREGRPEAARIWRSLHLQVRGALVVGTGDPDIMGMALGFLPMLGLPAALHLTPDFLTPRVQGWIELRGRTCLAAWAAACVRFLWRPAIRRRWWRRMRPKLKATRLSGGGA
jgi:hypothetical protein